MGKPTKTAGAKKKPGDFKRPKRKVGRKAPQAANVTSVAVASRRINMLEQSALLDKGDAAMTHRHATLQELLANAGHYNAHMRQRALQGLRELAQLHGDNVLANVAVVLERFLRTFVDEEAIVREAAVQTWKVLIAVMVEGKSLRPFAKLIAMYFCSGLTHLQIGIRQDTLRAISVLLEAAPELLSVDAGLDQLGRLIENFRDLIAAAQTQGIKITNQYDVLNSGGNGTGSSKTKKQGNDQHQHGSSGGNRSASTQKKPATSALTLRFSALTVLHKLLHSIDFSSDGKMNSTTKTMRDVHRMAAAGDTPALLLYASPILVLGNQSDLLRSVGFWQEKSRTLLRPLLDLWLECFGESDVLETLPEEYVENLQRIIECATVIVSANVDQLKEDAGEKKELLKTTRKLQEQLLARFPMFPGDNLTAGGDAYLSRWYGINVALAKFACVQLQLPPSIRSASAADLDGQVTQFVVSAMAKYAASDELRALASTHGIVRGLLDVLTSVLASLPSPQQRDELLDTFTQLYVKCSPRSMTFRICSSFVIERLSDFTRWPSWPIVLQWLTCFGNFMGQLDATHMALGRQCLFTMISVMKQLPTELATNGAADSVLQNLEVFFNLTAQDSTQFRFHDLSASDQLEFVSLVYHLPSYPVGLLRALASCCKSARVHLDAKSFLMDILHQRIEVLDLAHFVSFLMSGILGRVQGDKTEPWTLDQKQQHLQLTRHVCRVLLNMNMGASLAKILTPALSRQAAALGDMEPLDLHTLVLLYGACFASVKPIHRGELPADMVTTVVNTVSTALLTFPDSQSQELELLEDLVAMISLSDNVVRRIVDSLLQYATVDVAETITKKLRALQLLVQAAPLQPWFVEHNAFATQRLDAFEASHASKATEHVTQLARQVRGDLQLVRVGHTKP